MSLFYLCIEANCNRKYKIGQKLIEKEREELEKKKQVDLLAKQEAVEKYKQ